MNGIVLAFASLVLIIATCSLMIDTDKPTTKKYRKGYFCKEMRLK